jgi:predicted P-loop ATPase
MMPKISIYKNAFDTKGIGESEFDVFLKDIQQGRWQDEILTIRTIIDKSQRDAMKKRMPMVTIAGTFSERADKNLLKHSGFICIDIDDIQDLSDLKSLVYTDEYVYAGFDSISGYGLCLIFCIHPKKHREAFSGICEYLFRKYNVICDPTSVNESRARFVTYDPNLHYNPNAKVFDIYPEKQIPIAKIPTVLFAKNDFDNIILQIQQRNIDICPGYHEWLRIAFALTNKFSEEGRTYFHQISSIGAKYKVSACDRQYTACLKAGKTGITIATLYYYAKLYGIETVSKETKIIAQTAQINKKAERTKADAKACLKKDGLSDATQTDSILEQVFDQNVNSFLDDSLISKLQLYLRQSYELKRNVITRKIEVNGQFLDDQLFNDIWCEATKIFDKVTSEMLQRLINSSFTKNFNPLHDFLEKYKERKPTGAIDALFDSILSTDYAFTRKFGTKWLVSIIASIYGQHSPLMLVLSGTLQGTGKTEFFRRLLPAELSDYYAESKLDAGKDDEILMTQKLIIMDDEMGGKSKKDEKKLKEMLSKQTFSLREPYGKANVDLRRLSVLCGTTNNEDILSDPTGNRRIIPLSVYSINHESYNAVDKIDVIIEAYWLFKSGYEWELSRKDIKELNAATAKFEKYTSEYELILQYFRKPDDKETAMLMTATEIKNYLETNSVQRLSLDMIGKELTHIGFEQKHQKLANTTRRVYVVEKVYIS